VAERVGDVRDARSAPERAGDPEALLKVADERLPCDEEQVGDYVRHYLRAMAASLGSALVAAGKPPSPLELAADSALPVSTILV